MAINFPDSPSTNDTHTVGDLTWIWDGTVWKLTVPTALSPAGSDTQVQFNNNGSFAGSSSVIINSNGRLQVGDDTDNTLDSSMDMALRFDGSGYTGAIGMGPSGEGMYIAHNGTRAIIFAPNETERARVTGGSGYFYVGATGGTDFPGEDGFFSVKSPSGTPAASFYHPDDNSDDRLITAFSDVSSTGTKHFQVLLDGDVDNTNNSYGGLSDIRLKENIVDARDYYDDLRQLEVKNFNFCKAVKTEYDYDEDGEIIKDTKRVSLVDTDPKSRKKLLGLVAQPTEQAMPGLVKTDEEGYKHIRYSVLVPMLLQMCQKMADKIEALEAAIEG